jgi:hypothetical protein
MVKWTNNGIVMRSTEGLNHIKLQEAYYALYERDPKPTRQKELGQPDQPVRHSPPIDPDVLRNRLLGKQQDTQTIARLKDYVVKSGDAELVKLLFPDVDVNSIPKADPKIFEDQALAAFLKYNKELGYIKAPAEIEACRASEVFKNYLNIAKMVDYFANVIEDHPNMQDLSLENAYKIQVLFPQKLKSTLFNSFDNIFQVACKSPQNKALKDSYQPIHDLFLAPLPAGITYLNLWQNLISNQPDFAPSVISNVGNLPAIEKAWGEPKPKEVKPVEFKKYMASLTYTKYNEAPELAEFMVKLRTTEAVFNRTLDLVKRGQLHFKDGSRYQFADKKDDKIPDITVAWNDPSLPDGAKKAEGYYWTKLPNGDPRGLILGHITGCCQLITGNSEQCVIDGMNRDNNGFYVLLKVNKPKGFDVANFKDPNWWKDLESHAQIKAESYVWKSKAGNLCMDSLEGFRPNNLDGMDDAAIVGFTKNFGQKLINLGFDRLMIGKGGATPKILRSNEGIAETMLEGDQYEDSRSQAVLMESERLISARKQLALKFPNNYIAGFTSFKHAEMFRQLPEELTTELVNKSELAKKLNKRNKFFEAIFSSTLQYSRQNEFNDLIKSTLALEKTHPDKFIALTYTLAILAYTTGKVSVADLIDLDIEKIEALTSGAIGVYDTGMVSAADLKDLDIKKIKELTDLGAEGVYRTGKVSVADLKDLDIEKIEGLTSWMARDTYRISMLSAAKLRDLDIERIKLFTSELARLAFKNGEVKFDAIKDKDFPEIYSHLFNCAGLAAKPSDFEGLTSDKLELLTNCYNLEYYQTGKLSFVDLKDLDIEKIEVLCSWKAKAVYNTGVLSVDDLRNLDLKKINVLTSENALELYKSANGISAGYLLALEADKITLLASFIGNKFFTNPDVKFAEIKNKNFPEMAAHIFSSLGVDAKASDFLGLDINKLEALTHKDAFDLYIQQKVSFSNLKDLEMEKIKALTCQDPKTEYDALYTYRLEYLSFSDLKDLEVDKIKALTSFNAIYAYRTNQISGFDLIHLSVEEIKALTTNKAIEMYKSDSAITIFKEVLGENYLNKMHRKQYILEKVSDVKVDSGKGKKKSVKLPAQKSIKAPAQEQNMVPTKQPTSEKAPGNKLPKEYLEKDKVRGVTRTMNNDGTLFKKRDAEKFISKHSTDAEPLGQRIHTDRHGKTKGYSVRTASDKVEGAKFKEQEIARRGHKNKDHDRKGK